MRLSPESIKKWCKTPNGYTEAWTLQYNQHLGKTLLVPVDEPKSILDEIIKETILRRLPELMRDKDSGGGEGSVDMPDGASSMAATPTFERRGV